MIKPRCYYDLPMLLADKEVKEMKGTQKEYLAAKGEVAKLLNEGWTHEGVKEVHPEMWSIYVAGLPRDMADIQQGMRWKRLFTMFYSFFSAYHNLQTDQYAEEQARVNLNYRKEGEAVAVIKDERIGLNFALADYANSKHPSQNTRLGNPQRWWQYFFSF